MGCALNIVTYVCGMLKCDQSMKVQNLDNKPKTRKQTEKLETKNCGVSVEHRGVCVECSDLINL